MTDVDEQGRPEPPLAAGETDTLLGFLEFLRATLAWKCAGVDAAGLRATVAGSSMSLGGMLKHLAAVEDFWFDLSLHGRDPLPLWNAVDWDADPDWAWHSAAEDTPEQLRTLWQDAVERSRSSVKERLAVKVMLAGDQFPSAVGRPGLKSFVSSVLGPVGTPAE
jgi:hypothetical protein